MEARSIEVIMRIDFAVSNGTEIVAHAEKVSELVNCKDCENWQYDSVFKQGWCEGRERNADDYCSRPKRKEVKDGR